MNPLRWTERQCLLYLFPLIISISFAMDVFVPAIPMMSRFFKTSDSLMQASLYIFMITVALGQIALGPLADHYGRRRIVLCSAFLFLIGSLIAALSSSIHLFIIGRIVQAAGSCGTYLICFIIVRDSFSTPACARLFSLLSGINSMVASFAPIIGGLLIDRTQDWRTCFYFLMLLGLVMNFIAFYRIPNYAYPKQEFSRLNILKTNQLILRNINFRNYALVACVSLLALYLFCALSPGILITHLHLNPTHYGLLFGLNAMTVFIGNLLSARLTYFYPLEKIIRCGLLFIIVSCLLMIYLNYYEVSLIHFMLPMLCMTVGVSLNMGAATALALKDFKLQAGTATALLGACQFGLAGIIGILTSQCKSTPLILAFPVLSLGAIALFRLRKVEGKLLLAE